MTDDEQNALIAFFASIPVTLLGAFAALIEKFGVAPVLLPKLRAAGVPVVRQMAVEVPRLVNELIPLKDALDERAVESHADRAARAIREDLIGKLNGLSVGITRYADDVYRAVVADAALAQVRGETPAAAQHAAYDKLTRQGITGFTDSQGRNWELSAYVDMAVRTAAQRAYNVALLDRLQAAGFHHFLVSSDGRPCPLCQPWEGQVLTDQVPDDIAAHTIGQATAEGLFHPRCKHVLSGYTPGQPLPPTHRWGPEDEARYGRTQQQRALERNIRAAKRQLAGAFTPDMKAAATRKVRQAQANMRAFIDQTGMTRIPRREQLHL